MKLLTEIELKDWLKSRQLSWDEKYGYIDFVGSASDGRFWCLPAHGRRIVYFLAIILDSLDPWQYLILCKQGATGWYEVGESTGVIEDVHDQILVSTGVPRDFQGAIRFEPSEKPLILTLLFNQLLFGWCVWDDVYVIPDHARQIVKTSHHDVVHVDFNDPSRIAAFAKRMSEEKFELPQEVPDGTFKIPHWMRGKETS